LKKLFFKELQYVKTDFTYKLYISFKPAKKPAKFCRLFCEPYDPKFEPIIGRFEVS